MEITYGLLYGFILSIQFALGVILCFNYKKTIKHYFWEFCWNFILQIVAFVFINDWLMIKHPFVYSNTSENDMNQGLIESAGKNLSRSALLQIGVLLPLSIHCLYSASRRILFEKPGKRVRYDPSIKWIEYMISSSFQTLVLYSLYGQVGQTIWVAVGMKMFSMFSAYGFEQILIKNSEKNEKKKTFQKLLKNVEKKNEGLISKTIEKYNVKMRKRYRKEDEIGEEFSSSEDEIGEEFSSSEDNISLFDSYTSNLKKDVLNDVKDLKNNVLEDVKTFQNDKDEDIITRSVTYLPEFIIMFSFFMYSMFHYGPLFIYNDDRPEWVQAFLAGMILNDISFPLTMIYYKNSLGSVRVDIIYSIWSIVSKNTFDLIIVLGTKRVSNVGVILMIPLSLLLGFLLFWRLPKPPKGDITPFYEEIKNKKIKIVG